MPRNQIRHMLLWVVTIIIILHGTMMMRTAAISTVELNKLNAQYTAQIDAVDQQIEAINTFRFEAARKDEELKKCIQQNSDLIKSVDDKLQECLLEQASK